MKKLPLVSILIPCYNSISTIEKTISSVLDQTYVNIEIIINDDYSTDGTYNLIYEKYSSSPKITIHQNSKNLGMCGNWNVLFGLAKGKYLHKLDADDLVSPNFVSTCIKYAEEAGADFVGTGYQFLNINNNETSEVLCHKNLKAGLLVNPLQNIFVEYPFHLCFTLLRADFVKRISTSYYFMETEVGDAEFQLRAAKEKNFKAYFIPQKMGYYCFHGNNSSLTPLKQAKSFMYDVVSKHHVTLKKELGKIYRDKMLSNFKEYLKSMLLYRAPWDIKLLYTCLKYYFN